MVGKVTLSNAFISRLVSNQISCLLSASLCLSRLHQWMRMKGKQSEQQCKMNSYHNQLFPNAHIVAFSLM